MFFRARHFICSFAPRIGTSDVPFIQRKAENSYKVLSPQATKAVNRATKSREQNKETCSFFCRDRVISPIYRQSSCKSKRRKRRATEKSCHRKRFWIFFEAKRTFRPSEHNSTVNKGRSATIGKATGRRRYVGNGAWSPIREKETRRTRKRIKRGNAKFGGLVK